LSVEEQDAVVANVDLAMKTAGSLESQGAENGVYVLRQDSTPDVVTSPGVGEGQDWVGLSFTDHGYGSTTSDLSSVYGGFGHSTPYPSAGEAHWRLTIAPEVHAVWGANESERELVLDRDLRYTITKVEKPSAAAREEQIAKYENRQYRDENGDIQQHTRETAEAQVDKDTGWIISATVTPSADWYRRHDLPVPEAVLKLEREEAEARGR
jgi:hypothetical protein